jgi:hypothetical protein
LFEGRVALAASFEKCFLDGIRLKKLIQIPLLAPMAFKIVVLQFPGLEIADDGISPTVETNSQTRCSGLEEFELASLGGWYLKASTS